MDIAPPPLPALDPTLCPRCGVELDGPWVRFCHRGGHYAEAERRAEPTAWAKLPARSEKEIGAACDRELKRAGFTVRSLSQPRASMQAEGLADRYVTGNGVCAWIEYKRPGEEQSPKQLEFEADVHANGGRYLVMFSESDVAEWCREILDVV